MKKYGINFKIFKDFKNRKNYQICISLLLKCTCISKKGVSLTNERNDVI